MLLHASIFHIPQFLYIVTRVRTAYTVLWSDNRLGLAIHHTNCGGAWTGIVDCEQDTVTRILVLILKR